MNDALRQGRHFFLRSDIRDFFTKVPKAPVISFIREETGDQEFANFLESALRTELENEDEVKEWLHLFPSDEVGVPQGSSLSAFAGNIVLRDFDRKLNGRGISTIRYIDDFVILGPNERYVRKAFEQGCMILSSLQMTAYAPWENSEKATMGKIEDGIDFLGCHLNAQGVMPSRHAQRKFIKDLQITIRRAKTGIRRFSNVRLQRRAEDTYLQTLTRIDRKIRGWGDSYGFATLRQPFRQLDPPIDVLIDDFGTWFEGCVAGRENQTRRRMLGVALLADAKAADSIIKSDGASADSQHAA